MFTIGWMFFDNTLGREVVTGLCQVNVVDQKKINEFSIADTVETLMKALIQTVENSEPSEDLRDFPVQEVIREIAVHLQSDVELDLNLQIYGLKEFGKNCFEPNFVFNRKGDLDWESFTYGEDGRIVDLAKFLTDYLTESNTEMFSIGLSDNNTQLEIGLCDVISVGHEKNLTIQQVSDVVSLVEQVFIIPGKVINLHEFLYDLAGITGKGTTIEKDINLQHFGLDEQDESTLVFSRNIGNVVGNVYSKFYYGEGCTAEALHEFLFA